MYVHRRYPRKVWITLLILARAYRAPIVVLKSGNEMLSACAHASRGRAPSAASDKHGS